jgi:hypothetical protein
LPGRWTFSSGLEQAYESIKSELVCLESITERLELYVPHAAAVAATARTARIDTPPSKAFVVHGRDEAARDAVARFLDQIGVAPVILHEQANQGKTLIEKLEHYAAVSFAVVLLTPDDEGRLAGSDNRLAPRARQNVFLDKQRGARRQLLRAALTSCTTGISAPQGPYAPSRTSSPAPQRTALSAALVPATRGR